MNEPKRRGRPPKWAAAALIPSDDAAVVEIYRIEPAADAPIRGMAAQAYADRIWSGQSISLSRHERMGRIAAALEAQGLSMEGVTLP